MKKKIIKTEILVFDNSETFSEPEKEMINAAKQAALKAYAPYSNFFVGAAVLLENDSIFTGNNQENAAYPSGMCAERVAIFHANSLHPGIPVKAIAITAYKDEQYLEIPVSPCGACRQVILETETRFEKPIKIFLVGNKKIYIINNARTLLPVSFDKKNLE